MFVIASAVSTKCGSYLLVVFVPTKCGSYLLVVFVSTKCGSYLLVVFMYLFVRNVLCECNFIFRGKKLNKTLKP